MIINTFLRYAQIDKRSSPTPKLERCWQSLTSGDDWSEPHHIAATRWSWMLLLPYLEAVLNILTRPILRFTSASSLSLKKPGWLFIYRGLHSTTSIYLLLCIGTIEIAYAARISILQWMAEDEIRFTCFMGTTKGEGRCGRQCIGGRLENNGASVAGRLEGVWGDGGWNRWRNETEIKLHKIVAVFTLFHFVLDGRLAVRWYHHRR